MIDFILTQNESTYTLLYEYVGSFGIRIESISYTLNVNVSPSSFGHFIQTGCYSFMCMWNSKKHYKKRLFKFIVWSVYCSTSYSIVVLRLIRLLCCPIYSCRLIKYFGYGIDVMISERVLDFCCAYQRCVVLPN